MLQGSPAHLLRFDFVTEYPITVKDRPQTSGMSRIVVTNSTSALVPHLGPLLVPIYPRVRSLATAGHSLYSIQYSIHPIHSVQAADISSYAPYYCPRHSPLPSVLSSAANRPSQTRAQLPAISKSLRTMPDPVQRTASPYHDPAVKGPKSQQLSHGLSRLHPKDDKSSFIRSFVHPFISYYFLPRETR